ncbi:peptidase M16 [Fadolivirus algeromassiliense]|jgi:insulysin|uniref:Peptidase M16 n=1 Tax=Fadolivirus FV1/VV64 TaxID=3070911 RepID=A0A7D3V7V5_9VIRU|nr:peptidase M16 [Fadolivirus algeromassiliense]QKF94496.1 peptidase M16 [Fadolivirus FV1/VV64]
MQIIKSPNDRRNFRHVRLENELEVLLVSDPQTQKSAASLSVSVGSFHDDVDGIAHYLEHMLFMGSEKYPDENAYNLLVKENNGSTNAYTANDHTTYYFNCVPEGLFKVLDIFAQFFICPLFKEDSLSREMNAVESEYQNSLTNEHWRFDAVKKQFTKQSHPAHRFSMGSIKTLDIPNIRDMVMNFYNTHYSSHIMRLVVVGKESLNELESNVKNMFSSVPRRSVILHDNYNNMFASQVYGKIVPMKDDHHLDMYWEYYLSHDFDFNHIDDFMGHVIGHEGPGSLYDLLHKQMLAKSLVGGVSEKYGNYRLFSVSIKLTDDGFNQIDRVKQIVLVYLRMVADSKYNDMLNLYNEYKKTKEYEFEHYTVPDGCQFAIGQSSFWATKNINPKFLIAYPYLFEEYTESIHSIVACILSETTYENAKIFERSKSFDNEPDPDMHIEKWYGVKYNVCNKEQINYQTLNIQMTLPQLNKYLCTNVRIIKSPYTTEYPEMLPIKNMSFWWKYDIGYNTPDINLGFNMILKNKNSTIREKVLTRLYFECLDYVMNAEMYNINCANYKANISRSTNGFGVSISGYPEKFMTVLEFIITSLRELKVNLTEEMFNHVKDKYQRELENYVYSPPYNMINTELSINIANEVYPIKSSLDTLKKLHYNDLLSYDLFDTSGTLKMNNKRRFVSKLSNNALYGLIQGNVTYEMALEVGNYISQLNGCENKYEFTEQLQENEDNEFTKLIENPNESNACFTLAIKIGYLRPELLDNHLQYSSLLGILHDIVSEQYFDQLRTKEQLGYVAQSYVYNYGNDTEQPFTTYNFCVQSPNKDTSYLRERTMRFIKEFRDYLVNESEESINNIIQSQIMQLEKPFQNLKKSYGHNFNCIALYNGNFNIRKDKIEFLKNVNKEMLITFYDTFFSLQEGTYWTMSLENIKNKIETE